MGIDEKLARLTEEIETSLFYSDDLNEFIYNTLEETKNYDEILDFETFQHNLKVNIELCFDDRIQWLIIKEYSTIENLNKIDFETIEKDFFEDIKKCFDIVGV